MLGIHKVRVIRLKTDDQFLDKARTVCLKWAPHVTNYYIRPKTPMLTGELQASLDQKVNVTAGKNISIVWYARAEHAKYLEDVKRYGRHIASIRRFTTPHTEAPFMVPNIERAMPSIREAVAEIFS